MACVCGVVMVWCVLDKRRLSGLSGIRFILLTSYRHDFRSRSVFFFVLMVIVAFCCDYLKLHNLTMTRDIQLVATTSRAALPILSIFFVVVYYRKIFCIVMMVAVTIVLVIGAAIHVIFGGVAFL